MNEGLWLAKKNYLCILIKEVSNLYGGDDIVFLRQHCKEVLQEHKGIKIEEAIACYEAIKSLFLNDDNYSHTFGSNIKIKTVKREI